MFCCCRPDRSSAAAPPAADAPEEMDQSKRIGLFLLITTVVATILAIAFGANGFNSMVHISTSHITAGGLAVFAAITLIVGFVLYCRTPSVPPKRTLSTPDPL